jgi:hypothetical protein
VFCGRGGRLLRSAALLVPRHRLAFSLVLGLWAVGPAPAAQAQGAGLAGTWKAAGATTVAEVKTWGTDCGPKPRSATDVEQTSVVVKVVGNQLALAFPDRSVRSDACWSPNPNVRLTNATASGNRWRVECRTADGDAKKERGVYTVDASTADVLSLIEESDYDWQLNKSHCVAKVRITQRVARGAAALKPPEPPPEPAVTPTAPTGCTPGPLAKLRLRPSDAQIAPGEKICFTARALDATGCALPTSQLALKWELEKPAGVTATLSGSCFKAAASVAEAEGRFKVVVSSGSVRDEAVVSVTSADLSDITARRGANGSELDISESEESVSMFGIEAAVKRSSWPVKVALAALMLGCLAAAGWLLSLRLRKHERDSYEGLSNAPQRRRGSAPASGQSGSPPSASGRPGPTSGSGEQLICPTCRRGYPGGTEQCPKDGSVPIPYAEFTRQAQAADARTRTCTSCGAQLAAGAQFCGSCGAKVHS